MSVSMEHRGYIKHNVNFYSTMDRGSLGAKKGMEEPFSGIFIL